MLLLWSGKFHFAFPGTKLVSVGKNGAEGEVKEKSVP